MACLMSGLCFGQQNVPDATTYASFFAQAAMKSGSPMLLNGKDTGLVQPSAQEAIGLTDGEAALLGDLAIGCMARVRAYDEESKRPSILDERFQLIDADEQTKTRLRQKWQEIEDGRSRIIQA